MSEISPNLHAFETIKNLHSLGDAAISVLEKTKRPYELTGAEHMPQTGGFIVVANHFVRVDDEVTMMGSKKMNDVFETMGVITKEVRAKIPQGKEIVWTPSKVPRPEGIWPKGKTVRETANWLLKDAKFAAANVLRSTYLSLASSAKDVLPVPFGTKGLKKFFEKAVNRLQQGDVLAIFPEGEVTVAMRQARSGFSHLAFAAQVPVLPVSVYDEDGVLKVHILPLIPPPQDRKAYRDFEDLTMRTIAKNLPTQLRGVYS